MNLIRLKNNKNYESVFPEELCRALTGLEACANVEKALQYLTNY